MKVENHCSLQGASDPSGHQHLLDSLLKHRLLGVVSVSDLVGLQRGLKVCISNKFSVSARLHNSTVSCLCAMILDTGSSQLTCFSGKEFQGFFFYL